MLGKRSYTVGLTKEEMVIQKATALCDRKMILCDSNMILKNGGVKSRNWVWINKEHLSLDNVVMRNSKLLGRKFLLIVVG